MAKFDGDDDGRAGRALRHATGVLTADAGDQRVLFDPVAKEISVLNGTASVIWDQCGSGREVGQIVDALLAEVINPPDDLESQVSGFLIDLRDRGLLEDPEGDPIGTSSSTPTWSDVGGGRHRTHRVPIFDRGVELVGDDPDLIGRIADLFPASTDLPLAGVLGIRQVGDEVEVTGWRRTRRFPIDRTLEVAVGMLNQVATSEDTMLVLHASAVRAPNGAVVAAAAESGRGKSTLAAHLVARGWDYLGDEAIGVRPGVDGSFVAVAYPKPLSLRPGGLAALGLDPGEVDRLVRVDEIRPEVELLTGEAGALRGLVLVDHDASSAPLVERLWFDDAVTAVGESAFNLVVAGQPALDTLVGIAAELPVIRVRHAGGPEAIDVAIQIAASA